jgi:hypothetical protein
MKNHQCSIQAMFGGLTVGMREIVTVHDLEDEVVEDIAALLADLFTTYMECGLNHHQCSSLAMFRELAMGARKIVQVHDLKDEAIQDIAGLLGELDTNLAFCRAREAAVQKLFDELCAIYTGHRDEEPPSGRELLDDLLAMRLERCRKKQKPRRRGVHPAMAELLARLDRLGTDHDDAEDAASTDTN